MLVLWPAIAIERFRQAFDVYIATTDARALVQRQGRADARGQQGDDQRGAR